MAFDSTHGKNDSASSPESVNNPVYRPELDVVEYWMKNARQPVVADTPSIREFGNVLLVKDDRNSDSQPSLDGNPSADKVDIKAAIASLESSNAPADRKLADLLTRLMGRADEFDRERTIADLDILVKLSSENKAPLDRNALCDLITNVANPMVRHELLKVASEKQFPKAMEAVAKWLANSDENGFLALDRLFLLRTSKEAEKRSLSEKLLTLLNKSETQVDTSKLLKTAPPFDDECLATMVDLMNGGRSEKDVRKIKDLVTSKKSEEVAAGCTLLGLPKEKPDLLSKALKLLDSPDSSDVVKVLERFDKAERLETMLNLVQQGSMKTGVQNLLSANAKSSEELLDLLGSEFEVDKAVGERLLGMLNGDSRSSKSALKLLDVEARENREELLRFFDNPSTKKGAEVLLDLLDADNKTDIRAARAMVDQVRFSRAGVAESLMSMLGGSANEQAMVKKAVTSLSLETVGVWAELITDGKKRNAAETMLRLATGTADERKTAEIFMSKYNESQDFFSRLQTDPRAKRLDPLKERDTMVAAFTAISNASPAELDRICKSVSAIGDPSASHSYLQLFNDPKKKELLSLLTTDLLQGKKEDVDAARRLVAAFGGDFLAILGSIDHAAARSENLGGLAKQWLRESAEAVGTMLLDRENSDLGRLILQSARDIKEFTIMESLVASPEIKRSMNTILKDDPQLAKALLQNINTNFDLDQFLKLYSDPEKTTAAAMLRHMFVNNAGGGKLLSLLRSPVAADAQLGKDLLQMLDTHSAAYKLTPAELRKHPHLADFNQTPERAFARKVLNSNLRADGMAAVKELGFGDETKRDIGLAQKIVELAQLDDQKLIPALNRIFEDPARKSLEKIDSKKFLEVINNNPNLAKELLTHLSWDELPKAFDIADNPQRLDGFVKLLRERTRFRDNDVPNPVSPESDLVKVLLDRTTREDGQKFLDLLSNPNTAGRANLLMDSVRAGAVSMPSLMDVLYVWPKDGPQEKAYSRELNKILDNPDRQNVNDVQNFLRLAFDRPAKRRLAGSDEERKQVLDLLGKVGDGTNVADLLGLIDAPDPRLSTAGNKLLEIVRSGDSALAKKAAAVAAQPFADPVFDLLSKPEHADLAKDLIGLVDFSFRLNDLSRTILAGPSGKAMIADIVAMSSKPESAAYATALLNESERIRDPLYSMLKAPETSSLARDILRYLGSIEDSDQLFGLLLGNILTANSGKEGHAILKDLVARYRSHPEERVLINSLGFFTGAQAVSLNAILQDARYPVARETLKQMLLDVPPGSGNIPLVETLLQLRAVDAEKNDKILRMLNDTRGKQRESALRWLRRETFSMPKLTEKR